MPSCQRIIKQLRCHVWHRQLVNTAGEHLHVDLCANTVISSDKYVFPARFLSLKIISLKTNSSFFLFFFSFFSVLPWLYLLQRHLRPCVNKPAHPSSHSLALTVGSS